MQNRFQRQLPSNQPKFESRSKSTALHIKAFQVDMRACEIGGTDSSNISWALSPGPVVRANNPTKKHISDTTPNKQNESNKMSKTKGQRVTNGMSC